MPLTAATLVIQHCADPTATVGSFSIIEEKGWIVFPPHRALIEAVQQSTQTSSSAVNWGLAAFIKSLPEYGTVTHLTFVRGSEPGAQGEVEAPPLFRPQTARRVKADNAIEE